MSQTPDEPRTDIERQLRAIELKNEVREITGGKMQGYEADDIEPVIEEQFWENVLEYEKAPLTSAQEMLERQGVRLPDPDALSDESVSLKLWEIIDGLAKKHVFLQCTDHLSDRELYTHLIKESLVERMPDLPVRKNSAYHIDIIGSGSEEDTLLYHRYYADNRSRRQWMKDFPDYKMPKKEKPPFDRDRHLPKFDWRVSG